MFDSSSDSVEPAGSVVVVVAKKKPASTKGKRAGLVFQPTRLSSSVRKRFPEHRLKETEVGIALAAGAQYVCKHILKTVRANAHMRGKEKKSTRVEPRDVLESITADPLLAQLFDTFIVQDAGVPYRDFSCAQ
jgi:hypothetical protein